MTKMLASMVFVASGVGGFRNNLEKNEESKVRRRIRDLPKAVYLSGIYVKQISICGDSSIQTVAVTNNWRVWRLRTLWMPRNQHTEDCGRMESGKRAPSATPWTKIGLLGSRARDRERGLKGFGEERLGGELLGLKVGVEEHGGIADEDAAQPGGADFVGSEED